MDPSLYEEYNVYYDEGVGWGMGGLGGCEMRRWVKGSRDGWRDGCMSGSMEGWMGNWVNGLDGWEHGSIDWRTAG